MMEAHSPRVQSPPHTIYCSLSPAALLQSPVLEILWVLYQPVTSMTGQHGYRLHVIESASMNESCRFVLQASKLDVSMEWKGRCMPENILYKIRHVEYF
jgi:hypothetical protein